MFKTLINKASSSPLLPKSIEVVLILSMVFLWVMSGLALLTTKWTLIKDYEFSFSPKGLSTYISAFGNYGALFTGSVAVTVAYFGLGRLNAAIEANKLKEKYDRFAEWRTVLDVRMIEVDKRDPKMKGVFAKVRFNLFSVLYELKFDISNKHELEKAFSLFREHTSQMELFNNRYTAMRGCYPSTTYTYAFDSFRFLLLTSADIVYDDAAKDLLLMYCESLPSDRIIDANNYEFWLNSFLQNGGKFL